MFEFVIIRNNDDILIFLYPQTLTIYENIQISFIICTVFFCNRGSDGCFIQR